MNQSILPVEALNARDMDLRFLEELCVSADFAEWVVRKTHLESVCFEAVDHAQHSVSDADGESDLVFVFRSAAGERRALLIENKVNAPAQPDQAKRYGDRAQSGLKEGRWTHYETCIVAPAQYLDAGQKADGYGARLSYEDIAEWVEKHGETSSRHLYRARLVRDAIARARRQGISRTDPQVTAFWKAYWADVSTLYPELELKEPSDKGPGSTWIVFRPRKLGKRRTLDHKLERGVVDLSLLSARAEDVGTLREKFRVVLSAGGLSVVPTGKSAAIRIKVTELNPWESYAVQSVAAREGMKAAYQLWVLAHLLDPGV